MEKEKCHEQRWRGLEQKGKGVGRPSLGRSKGGGRRGRDRIDSGE